MTDTPTLAPEDAADDPAVPQDAPVKKPVSANSALVEWPRDIYGILSPLRNELLAAAGNIRGNPEKHALFLQTLGVAAQHAQARLSDDQRALALAIERETKRVATASQRVYGTPV